MDDNLAVCRTGELIDNQADALPHRLHSPAAFQAQTDLARFACCRRLPERARETHQPARP